MRRASILALCLAGAAIPSMATAQTYRFDIVDPAAKIGEQPFTPYHFFLPKAPTPGTFNSDATSFTLIGTSFGILFGPVAVDDEYTFFLGAPVSFGGLIDLENIYGGPQLFTGTVNAPIFKLGNFALDNFGTGARLVISDPNALAVPEPASWALMLAGLGAAGWAMRRARMRVRVAFI